MQQSRRPHARASRLATVLGVTAALCLVPLPAAYADGPGYGGDAGQLAVSWAPAAEVTPTEVTPSEQPAEVTPTDQTPSEQPAEVTPTDQPAEAPAEQPAEAPAEQPAEQPVEAPAEQPVAMGGGARGVAAVARPVAADPELQTDSLALIVRGLGFRGKSEIEVRIGSDRPVVARADSAGALAVALEPDALGAAKPGVSVMAVGRNQAGTEVTLFGSIPPVADGSGPMSIVPWAAASIALAGLALWVRRRHAQHEG